MLADHARVLLRLGRPELAHLLEVRLVRHHDEVAGAQLDSELRPVVQAHQVVERNEAAEDLGDDVRELRLAFGDRPGNELARLVG